MFVSTLLEKSLNCTNRIEGRIMGIGSMMYEYARRIMEEGLSAGATARRNTLDLHGISWR